MLAPEVIAIVQSAETSYGVIADMATAVNTRIPNHIINPVEVDLVVVAEDPTGTGALLDLTLVKGLVAAVVAAAVGRENHAPGRTHVDLVDHVLVPPLGHPARDHRLDHPDRPGALAAEDRHDRHVQVVVLVLVREARVVLVDRAAILVILDVDIVVAGHIGQVVPTEVVVAVLPLMTVALLPLPKARANHQQEKLLELLVANRAVGNPMLRVGSLQEKENANTVINVDFHMVMMTNGHMFPRLLKSKTMTMVAFLSLSLTALPTVQASGVVVIVVAMKVTNIMAQVGDLGTIVRGAPIVKTIEAHDLIPIHGRDRIATHRRIVIVITPDPRERKRRRRPNAVLAARAFSVLSSWV